jgi:hypothetical protein
VWALLVVGEQLNVQVVLSGAIILGAVSSYLVLDLRSRRANGRQALLPQLP